jgi:hypothetical protein
MDRRTQILVGVVVAAGLAFAADRFFISAWWGSWQKLTKDIRETDVEIGKAKATLAREDRVSKDWKKLREQLGTRPEDVRTHFMSHLGSLCDKAGVSLDVTGSPQPKQNGDKEYVYETRFKLTWEQFANLLGSFHNSKEFLKLSRISISSQYEKEERLDLDLKVSTIEYGPVKSSGAKP